MYSTPAESSPKLHKVFGTLRFPDQLFLRLYMYEYFGYLRQSFQHFVLYFMRDLVSLPDAEVAVYHDVQINIETESHFPHET